MGEGRANSQEGSSVSTADSDKPAATQIRLYDSLRREKVALQPIDPNNVRMYVCGPTVYDYAHIGLSLIHISEPTRQVLVSRMPSSA